jgi:hypothetical protein
MRTEVICDIPVESLCFQQQSGATLRPRLALLFWEFVFEKLPQTRP